MRDALVVQIVGAGKVGQGLARALRATGARVRLRPARAALPSRPIDADLLVLAVRDREIGPLASTLAERRLVTRRTPVVHCAGALDAEPLAPLRAVSAGVAQMHPMIAFASLATTPALARGQVHVSGDAAAVRVARSVAKRLGMNPRTIPGLDRVAYHGAAGLVANGAAALAAAGLDLLVAGGVERGVAGAMLGPLLRSVADNVEALGMPEGLTGPVRRGDAAGVARHHATIVRLVPGAAPLYVALVAAQLPLARVLGEAEPAAFDAIADWLARASVANPGGPG